MGSVVSFRSPVDCQRDGEPVSPAVRVERPALWKEGACLGGIQVSQLRRHVVTRESVRRWDRWRPPPSRCRPFRGVTTLICLLNVPGVACQEIPFKDANQTLLVSPFLSESESPVLFQLVIKAPCLTT